MSRAGESGFALIDAMVALGLLAMTTAMFVAAVQSAALARRHAALVDRATLIAQSALAQAIAGPSSTHAGRDGDLAWQAEVRPWSGRLEQITVTVSRPPDRHPVARLATLRRRP